MCAGAHRWRCNWSSDFTLVRLPWALEHSKTSLLLEISEYRVQCICCMSSWYTSVRSGLCPDQRQESSKDMSSFHHWLRLQCVIQVADILFDAMSQFSRCTRSVRIIIIFFTSSVDPMFRGLENSVVLSSFFLLRLSSACFNGDASGFQCKAQRSETLLC